MALMWHSNQHPDVLWFHTHTHVVRFGVPVMVAMDTVSWDVRFTDIS
jgi:hypothetical protein